MYLTFPFEKSIMNTAGYFLFNLANLPTIQLVQLSNQPEYV